MTITKLLRDGKLYRKIISRFSKKVYQNLNERVVQRLNWWIKTASLLKNKTVLDCGTNAGLFAVEGCKYASHYFGIDKKSNYLAQAQKTKEVAKLDNATFLNVSLGQFAATVKFDAIILSRVLYHLDEHEINLLRDDILPKCEIALVICGSKPKGERNHNSYKFHKEKSVEKFFEDSGMKFKVNLRKERFFCGIARKS